MICMWTAFFTAAGRRRLTKHWQNEFGFSLMAQGIIRKLQEVMG